MIRLVSSRLSATRDDGAIAIIVAICAVFLIGLSAFAVDFGNAFAVKRQLSVSADASAIAAARAVSAAVPPGKACDAAALQPVAQNAANLANSQNDSSGESTVSSVTVTCDSNGVTVKVDNQRQLQPIFGGLFGATRYEPAGTASAQLYVPGVAYGMRPIAACMATVIANYRPTATPPAATPFLVYVSKASAVCGTTTPGAWGFTNFLDQGAYGTFNSSTAQAYYPDETCAGGSPSSGADAGCQAAWTRDGYGGPVYFPNQALGGDTGLAGNTGLANSSSWKSGFDGLVDQIILLPVADRYNDQPGVDRLDVTGVLALRVCSVSRGGTVTQGVSSECSASRVPTLDPDLTSWTTLKNNEAAIWGIPVDYVTSGVSDPRANCFGRATCDFGVRAVRLFK
jgi:hypothetical protein